MKNQEGRTNSLVDFHIHGYGSSYKDSFATASYDQICAYFQKIADENNANFTIALTEHDSSRITFQEYKALQKKYPNVKIVLGMETNCTLRTATNDIFNRAHILTYADMSSDETIKRWLDCKELKDLSKINTFQLPCNYQYVKDYCISLNILYQLNLNVDLYANLFGDVRYTNEMIQERLIDFLVDDICKHPSPYFSNCHNKQQIMEKLKLSKVSHVKGEYNTSLFGLLPSVYGRERIIENLELALKRYNKISGDNFQLDSLKKQINFDNLTVDDMDSRFSKIISERIAKNKKLCELNGINEDIVDIPDYVQKKIDKHNKKPNLDYVQYFQNSPKIDKLGEKLYIAKSVLNKHLGLGITNDALARMLDYSKPRNNIRNEFIFYVKKLIEYKNPMLFNEIGNLNDEEFCEFKFGENKHGEITINNLISKNQYEQKFQSTDVRTNLEEINQIVKKTGAHLLLAHPNSIFDYRDNAIIKSTDLSGFDGELLSRNTKDELVKKCKEKQSISVEDIKNIENSKLFKLDLFFKLCERNGIDFEGFEVSKSDIDSPYLLNSLIFAAKHGLEISFGSDVHLSNLNQYYNWFEEGKIDENTFQKLVDHAYSLKDNTAENKKYEKSYSRLFALDGSKRKIDLLNIPIIKSHDRVYPNKIGYKVSKTSLASDIFKKGRKSNTLLGITIDNDYYEFNRDELENMDYRIAVKHQNNNNNKKNKSKSKKKKEKKLFRNKSL